MFDVIAPGAAVFEPEEVDVLTAACGLAVKKIEKLAMSDAQSHEELARLVHNLGRSRLKHHKRLRDAADAASLAEEAADLFGYLRSVPEFGQAPEARTNCSRPIPIFPAELRMPPTTTLAPRLVELPAVAQVGKARRERANVGRPEQSSRPRKTR